MFSIKKIILVIFAFLAAAFFAYGTYSHQANPIPIQGVIQQNTITTRAVSIDQSTVEKGVLVYKALNGPASDEEIVSHEFGRLGTSFVRSKAGSSLALSGSNTLINTKIQGIISWYDPFSTYTLIEDKDRYQLKQMTNGSYYISDEADGTVSIYSLDIVAKLSFYSQGQEMTNMILFPGMYIRFHPANNGELKGADLYRIMLVLDDEKNNATTGIEYINPRVSVGSDKDTLFVYRFPQETKVLFQMLQMQLRDRISQVDLIKNYNYSRSITTESTEHIINPGKKNYYLLDDLRSVLSSAVASQMDIKTFRSRIEAIREKSKSLLDDGSVQDVLEKFLADARFAVFGKIGNSQFESIYNETANILGITPDDEKGKFFQYLSDIYSRNIISQKKDPTFSGIDTYFPTAEALKATLQNKNIESKDYFDIALYAYQLLRKAQDKQRFLPEALGSSATYTLMTTLVGASERYVAGLDSDEKKRTAYHTIVSQFYAPAYSSLTQGLYANYTKSDGARILIDANYLESDMPRKLPTGLGDHVMSALQEGARIYNIVNPLYLPTDDQFGLIALRDALLRINGFMSMIDDPGYATYRKSPYAPIDVLGVMVPKILPNGSGLATYEPTSPAPLPVPPTIPEPFPAVPLE